MEIRLSIQTQDGDPAGAERLGKNKKMRAEELPQGQSFLQLTLLLFLVQ